MSPTAPKGELKTKHHLCISEDGLFLFVSTHRARSQGHRGVLVIPNSYVPFLPPTQTNQSEISCTVVIERRFPDPTVPKRNPRGKLERRHMANLLLHVRTSIQLSDDEKDAILETLYDYYGADLG